MTAHPIPDAALDADIATLAKKGAGKTYLNKGLVERLLDMKRRVVVMDPLSVWWGLKALADGSPGYPVVVVGGPQADVPLDPTKGAELAAYVARTAVRMVIDVSELRAGALTSFSTAFLGELYRLNRDPLWLVLEEADVFAPQNPQGNESFMLHEVDMIARRGRQRGFRLWTICQRPQEINKKTLSQTTTMVLMRLMSPQDREAAKKWLLAHGTKDQADQILTTLPSLGVGEGYVLAPELDLLERARFPTIRTLDNSATPKAGEKRVGVKALAKVDVGALREALKPDPAPPTGGSAVKPGVQRVVLATSDQLSEAEKRGYDRGFIEGIEEGERRGSVSGQALMLTRVRNALDGLRADQAAAKSPIRQAPPEKSTAAVPVRQTAPGPKPEAPPADAEVGEVSGSIRKLLDAIAWWNAFGLEAPSAQQVGFIAGYAPTGGTFRTYRGAAKGKGLIAYPSDGRLALTDAGRAFAQAPAVPPTVEALHEAVRANIGGSLVKMLDPLLRVYPEALTAEQVGEEAGYEAAGGTFRTYRGKLKGLEIIDYPGSGLLRAADWLFPEAR